RSSSAARATSSSKRSSAGRSARAAAGFTPAGSSRGKGLAAGGPRLRPRLDGTGCSTPEMPPSGEDAELRAAAGLVDDRRPGLGPGGGVLRDRDERLARGLAVRAAPQRVARRRHQASRAVAARTDLVDEIGGGAAVAVGAA